MKPWMLASAHSSSQQLLFFQETAVEYSNVVVILCIRWYLGQAIVRPLRSMVTATPKLKDEPHYQPPVLVSNKHSCPRVLFLGKEFVISLYFYCSRSLCCLRAIRNQHAPCCLHMCFVQVPVNF